jgi:hypothetical protein
LLKVPPPNEILPLAAVLVMVDVPALRVRLLESPVFQAMPIAGIADNVKLEEPRLIVLTFELNEANLSPETEKLFVVNVPAVNVIMVLTVIALPSKTVPPGASIVKLLSVFPPVVNVAVAVIVSIPEYVYV